MINVFNSNYEEIGSLDKNLALHTLGKVKIRYGRKYIDLLNDKGELNVSIPKILLEKDSLEDITKDGFYLVDGNLYAYYKGNIYLLTGVEGDYISFAVEQNLTQELIDTALNNIGLEFKNITKAKQVIHNGIVFIDDKIFYIDGDDVEELTLREPLSSINNLNMGLPSSDNVAIIYKNGHWEYSDIITLKDLVDLELKIKKDLIIPEKEEEDKNDYEIFDPILYSKVYTIKTAEITSPENNSSNVFLDSLKTIPEFNLQTNDIAILSIPAEKSVQNRLTQINSETTIILGVDTEIIHSDNEVKYEFLEKLDVLTFNLIYKNNKLYFCDKNGNNISLEIGKGKLVAKLEINEVNSDNILNYETVIYIKLFNSLNQPEYWIVKNLALEKRHIYIKAEEPNHLKFKIDYKNAQIALEENTPGNSLSILPHTVLGDLDDADKYYKDPAVSFRTYTEKQSKQGLYSDLPVFSGGEFRGRWPAELTSNELVLNFPRYSKNLNNDLCTNHPASDININNSNDLWRLVIPTIEWVLKNGSSLNNPLLSINTENRSNLPEFPTEVTVEEVEPYEFEDSDNIPIAIVYKNGHWSYEPVVPFSWFIACCLLPLVSMPKIYGTNNFEDTSTITITCKTQGATIYYTTDGTNPTSSSTQYLSSFTINLTTTIKAIAIKDQDKSLIRTKRFNSAYYKVTYNFNGGTYNNSSGPYIESVETGYTPSWGNYNHPTYLTGYFFNGWSLNGEKIKLYNIDYPVTLTAIWHYGKLDPIFGWREVGSGIDEYIESSSTNYYIKRYSPKSVTNGYPHLLFSDEMNVNIRYSTGIGFEVIEGWDNCIITSGINKGYISGPDRNGNYSAIIKATYAGDDIYLPGERTIYIRIIESDLIEPSPKYYIIRNGINTTILDDDYDTYTINYSDISSILDRQLKYTGNCDFNEFSSNWWPPTLSDSNFTFDADGNINLPNEPGNYTCNIDIGTIEKNGHMADYRTWTLKIIN